MTFRRLATPVCLAVLLFGLPGCGSMKFSSSEPAGGDPLALGNAAYDRKDYAAACRELSKVGSAGPETLARAGDACVRDGREKGERAFTTALSANASYAPAMEGMGLIALSDGNVGRARDMLEAAAKAGGNDPRAAVALGDALLLSGQCDKALTAYQTAVRGGGAGQAKSRLDAARVLCAARGKGTASPAATSAPASSRSAGATGSELSPSASPTPSAGSPKEPAKPKAAPRTIDLNDI
ncbi:tetratricopeptide repeat protein [Solidesulfovibrio alcoholivorans]|uniref:tetratricopeptide repeat protein n=1 Tax=Solidesulfovibrio alcoholivorans TaxID=81406 RepID=UPI000497103B|nr:tetratricopeptide repeat protein [Solidesulfovibrio alcoholivorans]